MSRSQNMSPELSVNSNEYDIGSNDPNKRHMTYINDEIFNKPELKRRNTA